MKNLRPVFSLFVNGVLLYPRLGLVVPFSQAVAPASYLIGGIGFFPFIKPRFHLPPRFGSSIAIGEDKVQAAVMPPAPGYFLL